MKKRYNITLDASTYEEFKQYVDNVSGFFNSVMPSVKFLKSSKVIRFVKPSVFSNFLLGLASA